MGVFEEAQGKLDLTTTQFSRRRKASMCTTASNTELNPEKRDLQQKFAIDWRISMLSSGSGRMWALLLLASSLLNCAAGADQSVISPKLKRLRDASEPYSWAHLAKGTNKQPGMVDVGRMPGTNCIEPSETKWGLSNVRPHTVMHCSCDERFRNCLKVARTQAADIVGNLFFNVINIPCFVFSKEPVCTARNWWGRCTLKEEKPVAIWKRPLPYWNRSA